MLFLRIIDALLLQHVLQVLLSQLLLAPCSQFAAYQSTALNLAWIHNKILKTNPSVLSTLEV